MADNRLSEALDILAAHQAADDIAYAPVERQASGRRLPLAVRTEIRERKAQIAAKLRPDVDLYEAAYDAVVHGTGDRS